MEPCGGKATATLLYGVCSGDRSNGMKPSPLSTWTLCALFFMPMPQFRPPNPSGISAAYLGLHYSDVNAHDLFWNALGGRFGDVGQKPTNRHGIHVRKVMNFPGIVVYGLGRGVTNPTAGTTTISVQAAAPPGMQRSVPGPPAVVSPAALSFRPTNPNIDSIGFRVKSLTTVTANLRRVRVMPLEGSTALVGISCRPTGLGCASWKTSRSRLQSEVMM
jgi:hypothetical protein